MNPEKQYGKRVEIKASTKASTMIAKKKFSKVKKTINLRLNTHQSISKHTEKEQKETRTFKCRTILQTAFQL